MYTLLLEIENVDLAFRSSELSFLGATNDSLAQGSSDPRATTGTRPDLGENKTVSVNRGDFEILKLPRFNYRLPLRLVTLIWQKRKIIPPSPVTATNECKILGKNHVIRFVHLFSWQSQL